MTDKHFNEILNWMKAMATFECTNSYIELNKYFISNEFFKIDFCRDTSDDSEDEYAILEREIVEYEVDELSSSEDLESRGSSSGVEVTY